MSDVVIAIPLALSDEEERALSSSKEPMSAGSGGSGGKEGALLTAMAIIINQCTRITPLNFCFG